MRNEAQCPQCDSKQFKKLFLGMPRFFGLHPALYSSLLLISGVGLVITGAGNYSTSRSGPADWLLKIVVGVIIATVAMVGLVSRNFRCSNCGRRFYRLPIVISAEERISKELKRASNLELHGDFARALSIFDRLAKDPQNENNRDYAANCAQSIRVKIENQKEK